MNGSTEIKQVWFHILSRFGWIRALGPRIFDKTGTGNRNLTWIKIFISDDILIDNFNDVVLKLGDNVEETNYIKNSVNQ